MTSNLLASDGLQPRSLCWGQESGVGSCFFFSLAPGAAGNVRLAPDVEVQQAS